MEALWVLSHIQPLFSWHSLSVLAFTLSASSSVRLPEPCRQRWWSRHLLIAECPNISHSQYIVRLLVSAFAPTRCKRKLLRWWLMMKLIHEYSRISIGIILLLCSFRRRRVVGFILGPGNECVYVCVCVCVCVCVYNQILGYSSSFRYEIWSASQDISDISLLCDTITLTYCVGYHCRLMSVLTGLVCFFFGSTQSNFR